MNKENKKLEDKTGVNTMIIVLIIMTLILFMKLISAAPNGATINFTKSSSFGAQDSTMSIDAYAGNVTEINIYGASITQSWQGYYGNVSGGFELADGAGNIFYNWSSISSSGQIYASVNSSIIWTNIECFNFTANGSYYDDSANRGGYSLFGMNSSQLDSIYNIDSNNVDGVENTFIFNNHRTFYCNGLRFDSGKCHNIKIMNSTGDGVFEEVLLYAPDNKQVVFASLLQPKTIGFDNLPHDFQMMVLDDGHGTNTAPTTYFFYIELG